MPYNDWSVLPLYEQPGQQLHVIGDRGAYVSPEQMASVQGSQAGMRQTSEPVTMVMAKPSGGIMGSKRAKEKKPTPEELHKIADAMIAYYKMQENSPVAVRPALDRKIGGM